MCVCVYIYIYKREKTTQVYKSIKCECYTDFFGESEEKARKYRQFFLWCWMEMQETFECLLSTLLRNVDTFFILIVGEK
jgi:hypothetical protein